MSQFAQAIQLALQHHGAGRLDAAEAIYRQVLAEPGGAKQPDALHLLGVIAHQRGDHAGAVDLITRACAVQPNSAAQWSNLGEAQRALGRFDDAEKSLRRAIALQPTNAGAHGNLGLVLAKLGRDEQACNALSRAVELSPASAQYRIDLAWSLMKLRRLDEAADAAAQALAMKPDDPKALEATGTAFTLQRHFGRAIEMLRRALAADAKLWRAWLNLGDALQQQGDNLAAVEAFQKGLSLGPPDPTMQSWLLFSYNYSAEFSQQFIFEQTLKWEGERAHTLMRPHPNPLPQGEGTRARLRVGFVSPDFRTQSVAFFLEPIIERLDRDRFEIHLYSDVAKPDETTARLRAMAQGFRDTVGVSHEKVARFIRDDGIDVLFDLAGHTGLNRMPVFATGPARMQVSYLGYVNTTALRAIQYRLTDVIADPPGVADQFYTERLIRLPGCAWCYRPPPDTPDVVVRDGSTITFGCFNVLAKMTPQVIALWSRILSAVPRSRLMLKTSALDDGPTREVVAARFAAHGVDRSRLELLGRDASFADHLNRYHQVDIILDPFPYNGTTTTCEALWMGVPVVALEGNARAGHAGRVGASLLTNAGLPELLARSEDDYLRIAVELVADVGRRAELRRTMRDRLRASPLMDEARHAREIEQVLLEIVRG